mgnify:CR=1 FL=1
MPAVKIQINVSLSTQQPGMGLAPQGPVTNVNSKTKRDEARTTRHY